MGILYRCQDQNIPRPTGRCGDMGVSKPHRNNFRCHHSCDCCKCHDTEVRTHPWVIHVNSPLCSCFTRAAKHALRQHMGAHRSISLADLSIGVAVARASFACKRRPRYLGPTVVTLFISIVFGLVNCAYVQAAKLWQSSKHTLIETFWIAGPRSSILPELTWWSQ